MMSKMLNSTNPAYYEFSEHELARIDPTHYPGMFDETIYESDEFRMYGYKIKRCPRMRSHDWTLCPFAHRGEKARRRDPRRYNYAAVSCPDYRSGGECRRGETCQFAHGVFEYWLHPGRYRTRECNEGDQCTRQVCFFAHTPEELREEIRYNYVYRVRPVIVQQYLPKPPAVGGGVGATPAALPVAIMPASVATANGRAAAFCGESSDFLASLSGLTIKEGEKSSYGTGYGPESGGPDIEWITELVEY